jgi:hypothetical protein
MARGKAPWAPTRPGFPQDAERNDGDFGEVCGYRAESSIQRACAVSPRDRFGIPIPALSATLPDGARIMGGSLYRKTYIPYNNIGKPTASPGNPKLNGTPYQLSGGAGDLIDPVAKRMMQLFPGAPANMANPTIYDNWSASGASRFPNDQFDIKIDHRFNEKNLMSAKYSQEWAAVPSRITASATSPTPVPAVPTRARLTCLPSTMYAHVLQNALADGNPWLHAVHDAHPPHTTGLAGVTDPVSKLGFPSYLNSNGFMGVPSMFIIRELTIPPATPALAATLTAITSRVRTRGSSPSQ